MNNKLTAIILLWLVVSVLNFGALNAADRFRFHKYCGDYYQLFARRDAAAEAMISVIPIFGSIVAVTESGFFEHGFSWRIGCPK
jgi:hypothetical protein